jgi:hypothetical protein
LSTENNIWSEKRLITRIGKAALQNVHHWVVVKSKMTIMIIQVQMRQAEGNICLMHRNGNRFIAIGLIIS